MQELQQKFGTYFWKILLPVGFIFILLIFLKIIILHSIIYWIGIYCFAIGIAGAMKEFMFRKPSENLKSMSIVGEYNPHYFKRNMISTFILILVLIFGFWLISLFN